MKRRDDWQILNGIFYVRRIDCPWRHLPGRYGPYTMVDTRFRRWTQAGSGVRIVDTVVDVDDGDVVVTNGTSARVYHAGVTLEKTTPDDA